MTRTVFLQTLPALPPEAAPLANPNQPPVDLALNRLLAAVAPESLPLAQDLPLLNRPLAEEADLTAAASELSLTTTTIKNRTRTRTKIKTKVPTMITIMTTKTAELPLEHHLAADLALSPTPIKEALLAQALLVQAALQAQAPLAQALHQEDQDTLTPPNPQEADHLTQTQANHREVDHLTQTPIQASHLEADHLTQTLKALQAQDLAIPQEAQVQELAHLDLQAQDPLVEDHLPAIEAHLEEAATVLLVANVFAQSCSRQTRHW